MDAVPYLEDVMTILGELGVQSDLDASSPLIESGLLDSFGILELVNHLEKRFEIRFDGQDLIPENFHSAGTVAALIAVKLGEEQ